VTILQQPSLNALHKSKLYRQPISSCSFVISFSVLPSNMRHIVVRTSILFLKLLSKTSFHKPLKYIARMSDDILSFIFCVCNKREACHILEGNRKTTRGIRHDESHDNLRKTTCHFHISSNNIAANKLVMSTSELELHRKRNSAFRRQT
jgi:hypothetical protein